MSVEAAAPSIQLSDRAGVRLAYADVARLIGLFLVYHGHVVERMMYLGNAAAAHQYKFIYSFHMPLFFVLSGLIAKDWAAEQSIGRFARSRFFSRIVPLIFFNAALALLSLIHKPDFPPIPLATGADYASAALMTALQLPVFDVPTWFLMCLVVVECIHFTVFRFLRGSDARIVVAIIAFYLAGYALNSRFQFFQPGNYALPNWWIAYEAITMYALYLVGVLVRRRGWLSGDMPRFVPALLAIAGFAAVLFTYDLNQGPFRMKIEAVVILAAAHGHVLWFPLTALAGTLAVLALGKLLERADWMAWLGRNALILFCLNGIVYHHVNGPFAAWFMSGMPQDGWSVAAGAALLSLLSIALAVPLVAALNRWLPQLVGRPTASGPLLPRLL
jgi:acyltransferase